MKKICVLSDIHADVHALHELLQYISKDSIDCIINLGDFVQGGPNPNEVFDIVMNDDRFVNIMGNTELEIVNGDYNSTDWDTGEITHEKWIVNKIGEARIKRLKDLPLSNSIEINGKKFFMMHNKKELFSNDSPVQPLCNIIMNETESLDNLTKEERILSINEHDYHLVSDNHLQGLEQFRGYTFVKPGAVSGLESGDIKFAIINIADGEEAVSFKKLKYDTAKLIKDCVTYNVPENNSLQYKNKLPKERYDIYIHPKYDIDIIKMDWSFWKPLMERLLPGCNYIQFSCWASEKSVVQEITSRIDNAERDVLEENENQLFFKVLCNDTSKNILLNSYLNEKDCIKWFEVCLYSESEAVILSASHYGTEIHIDNIPQEELDFIKSIINPKFVALRI